MISDIVSKLETIQPANGFLFAVTEIAESDDSASVRLRGIAYEQTGDRVDLRCNAETRTLEQLRRYIFEVLSKDYEVESDGLDCPMTVRPRNPKEEATDAITETIKNIGGGGRKHSRHSGNA